MFANPDGAVIGAASCAQFGDEQNGSGLWRYSLVTLGKL
jgi:hypothetical protein